MSVSVRGGRVFATWHSRVGLDSDMVSDVNREALESGKAPEGDDPDLMGLRVAVGELSAMEAAGVEVVSADWRGRLAAGLAIETAKGSDGWALVRRVEADVLLDGKVELAATVEIFDPKRLEDVARETFERMWGGGMEGSMGVEEMLFELFQGSNDRPSPDEMGFAFGDVSPNDTVSGGPGGITPAEALPALFEAAALSKLEGAKSRTHAAGV